MIVCLVEVSVAAWCLCGRKALLSHLGLKPGLSGLDKSELVKSRSGMCKNKLFKAKKKKERKCKNKITVKIECLKRNAPSSPVCGSTRFCEYTICQ